MKKLNVLLLLLLIPLLIIAQEKKEEKKESKGKLYGKVFANFHKSITDADHNSAFELKRAYFGYKYDFSEGWGANIKLDVATGSSEPYQFMYVKNAYVKYKAEKFNVRFGLADSYTFKVQEKFWGYRYIYKSFMDANKFGNSSDLGVYADYKITDFLSIDASMMNGEGYKKIQADLYYRSSLGISANYNGLITRVYADYTNTETKETNVGAFLGYKFKKLLRIGTEFAYSANNKSADGKDKYGYSVYSTFNINKKINLFGRYDNLMSNTLTGATDPWNKKKNGSAVIAGIEYRPIKKVNLALNYQGEIPEDKTAETESTLYFNVQVSF